MRGKSDDELAELMGMEHRAGQLAPAKTSLRAGTSLQPGHVLRVAYNQLEDFKRFRYDDWRADMRYTARLLLDFLRERRPVGGRWSLVGHSQGGLLIIAASKLMGTTTESPTSSRPPPSSGAPVARSSR